MKRRLNWSARRLRSRSVADGAIVASLPRAAISARRRRTSSEAGSATVRMAALLLLLLMGTVVIFNLGALLEARHRAHAAADLGAIAAARAVELGASDVNACAAARAVAEANGAMLSACEIVGEQATVEADAVGASALPTLHARAVAKPAEP